MFEDFDQYDKFTHWCAGAPRRGCSPRAAMPIGEPLPLVHVRGHHEGEDQLACFVRQGDRLRVVNPPGSRRGTDEALLALYAQEPPPDSRLPSIVHYRAHRKRAAARRVAETEQLWRAAVDKATVVASVTAALVGGLVALWLMRYGPLAVGGGDLKRTVLFTPVGETWWDLSVSIGGFSVLPCANLPPDSASGIAAQRG